MGVSRDSLGGRWFRFSGLDAGSYRVTIEAEGYEPHTYTADVTPGVSGFRSIPLERAKTE